MKKVICFIFPITTLLGQINYTGSIKPGNMYRLSDQSEISLPFRLAEAEVGYSLGDFEIKTNSAIEYRWSNNENEFQLREAYLMWYPSWGEAKVGKQIHAWGAVDGNNPTDNLNPYDYYYMFLPGAERKVGTISGSVKYYWNDWQMEGVFIPEHEGNRFPFGEEAFPLDIPMVAPKLMDEEPGSEFGFRFQSTLGSSDFSLSYFDGRDQSFSYVGVTDSMPSFFYRKTSVLGFDLVSFIGGFTNRFEIAHFSTKIDVNPDTLYFDNAAYIQYAEQIEYTTPNDIMLSVQLIGYIEGDISWQEIEGNRSAQTSAPELIPGMGTPFASFTDLGLSFSASANYYDDALELMGNTFIDLKDSQSMLGVSAKYSPKDNWKLNMSVSKFTGEEGTQFHEMEDFSHLKVGLEFHF
ncbi:MAG: hypothetical protein HOI72_01140 [Candidatus Marinimicrobia bacterium]|jgi:hypothetical protein|nr:hypothetical protein [Candidatus Neomarinimicrobiota bacterium]MBT4370147.1 hypothetical protein [Candidatus Neomarinimicrobiota bacterium]MBT4828611.1 hypothetical protein [Candidatus Neomarinimicrobiota bacterium]MBT5224146.1 hypothetical protein [Candidatus Neomarinimicrobiota bacterium]MBT5720772.1 hypothetical protein [Candidatus Neomarinimicrobiota bacterium]